MQPKRTDWDVVVVGAGPAGSTAALGLARAGASVLLVDRSPFPRWKVCGACLGPGALGVLRAEGLAGLPDRLGARPLRVMVLSAAGGGRKAVRLALAGSRALSRNVLDQALVEEARAAGAVFRAGRRASLEERVGERWLLRLLQSGEERSASAAPLLVTTRAVVDATGLGGGLAAGVGARSAAHPQSRIGLGAVVADEALDVPSGELHMVVAPEGYAGVVGLGDGRVCVAAAVDPGALRGRSPANLAADILRAPREPVEAALEGWRGTPPLTRDAPRDALPGLYAVGDAAGYVEPFTGEGIGWALAEGAAVSRFVARALRGRPEVDAGARVWAAARSAHRSEATRLCRFLARGLRSPRLVEAALRVIRVAPPAVRPLVRRASRVPPVAGLGVA